VRVHHRVTVECDVPEGVEAVAADEVRERISGASRIGLADGKVSFELGSSELGSVRGLRTVAGAWVVEGYEGRRPTVLLSDRRLVERVRHVARLSGPIETFTLSAPGLGSPAMRDVRRALAHGTCLREAPDGLLIRMRRRRGGWDVLIALTSRPLAQRTWRVARTSGSMNGPLAAAMVRLTRPGPDDRFLNVACGAGTIAIERRLHGPATRVVGVDVAPEAVGAAARNARSAGEPVAFAVADGRQLPFPRDSFDVVCADLPWGYEVGSHERNVTDYAALLAEAGRVCRRRARACILTAETRLMQRVLGSLAGLWRLDRLLRVEQGGARPGLYVLRRA
jgi:tRNA (guanine6-N2)-methyltransferase